MVAVRQKLDEEARLWSVLASVPDPEIPAVSLVDLGIVREADLAMRRVLLTPTYTGCPATLVIETMVRAAGRRAMGGPLEKLATSADGSIDPRFQRLGLSLARMEALDRGLEGIPQYRPAANSMTSSFGARRDPFTGSTAMHAGIDFSGPAGSPIYAAAKGRVSFVGVKSGYGNVVEIAHGNGMVTRYAHMSRFRSRVGQEVEAGDVIGAIGSTGRSTGPHLHFEVRVNDRAVNPRPFLEAAPNVLKEARRVHPEQPARG